MESGQERSAAGIWGEGWQAALDAMKPLHAEIERLTALQKDPESYRHAEVRAETAERELDRVRTQLAGCGVAAIGDTCEAAANRADPGSYGWSPAYADVCRMVDRLIESREEAASVPGLKALVESLSEQNRRLAARNRYLEDLHNDAVHATQYAPPASPAVERYRNRGDHSVKVDVTRPDDWHMVTMHIQPGVTESMSGVLFDLLFEPDEPNAAASTECWQQFLEDRNETENYIVSRNSLLGDFESWLRTHGHLKG